MRVRMPGRPVFSASTLVHLRIPFFLFLLPIYLFSLAVSPRPEALRCLLVFIILHFLLYPASNGFNSFYDRDRGSIGGIERPPAVTRDLLLAVNLLDMAALGLGLILGWVFTVGVACFIAASRLYSWDRTRLKRRPVLSWLMVALGQGSAVFLVSYQAINRAGPAELLAPRVISAAGLAGLLLMAAYPMTQVYQHEEDGRRGETTLSMLLGIRGTFRFAAVVLALATAGFAAYFLHFSGPWSAGIFLACQVPVAFHFLAWKSRVNRALSSADYRSAMAQNLVTSLSLSACFLAVAILGSARLP